MLLLIISRRNLFAYLLVIIALIGFTMVGRTVYLSVSAESNQLDSETTAFINEAMAARYIALMDGQTEALKAYFRMDTNVGRYAYEHQVNRINYLNVWAKRQGVQWKETAFNLVISRVNHHANSVTLNVAVYTKYSYAYIDDPESVNSFKIGTYHTMDILLRGDVPVIQKEWYSDPFADTFDTKQDMESLTKVISAGKPKVLTELNKRREGAVAYAKAFAGQSLDVSDRFVYNKKYRNYNYTGGDCTNFISQVLHEGGKFPMNATWRYQKGGSSAWVNANAFKNYLLYSNRGSLIAKGTYAKVLKASYQLLPGDIISYCEKGKVAHNAVVTGFDSKGYPMINCHDADRYNVPWDLGWNEPGITFYLIRVHYE